MSLVKNAGTVFALAGFFVFLGSFAGNINSSLIGIDMSQASSFQVSMVKTCLYIVALSIFYEGGKLL